MYKPSKYWWVPYVWLVALPKKTNKIQGHLKTPYFFNSAGYRAILKGPASVLAAVESFGSLQLPPTNPPSVPSKEVIMMIPAWAMGKTFGNHGGLFVCLLHLAKITLIYILMLWIWSWFIDVYWCWLFLYNICFPTKSSIEIKQRQLSLGPRPEAHNSTEKWRTANWSSSYSAAYLRYADDRPSAKGWRCGANGDIWDFKYELWGCR